jgi:hypothetical protein
MVSQIDLCTHANYYSAGVLFIPHDSLDLLFYCIFLQFSFELLYISYNYAHGYLSLLKVDTPHLKITSWNTIIHRKIQSKQLNLS